MAHVIVPEAEAILDKEFKVLDKGFVRLVDYLGGDERIVQSARVSYGAGTKSVREDKGLINYLMRHLHTSPFEQVLFTFHCKMPIFVARQWVRHRTARLNEISGRYSIMESEFYVPTEADVRYQSKQNKQGRSEDDVPPELRRRVIEILTRGQQTAYDEYSQLLDDDIARELARINLPLSLYTQWYWQIDLHNLFHFLKLRLDSHAQYEIRAYGEAMAEMVKAVAPLAWDAFEEHRLYGAHFSRSEVDEIRNLIRGTPVELKGRNRREFFSKLGLEDKETT
jgi:thymidylate synthase (FAD)